MFLLGCMCTSALLSCFLDALTCAVCKWSHYKLKRGRWPFPQRITIQRKRTNTFKKCQHKALLFKTDSSRCQSVPQSRFTHTASVLQKQLHVPWWFIMSDTFWHLVLHTFFSCWNLTKGDKMLEVKLKNCYSSAILLYAQLHPPSQGRLFTGFPCGAFLACRGLLSKWCSTSCLSRLLLFRVSSVTLQCHSSTLWSFLLPTHSPQHASFFTTTVTVFGAFFFFFYNSTLFTFHKPRRGNSELVREKEEESKNRVFIALI